MKDTKAIIDQISDEFGSTFSFVSKTDTGYRLANLFHRPNDKTDAARAIQKILGKNTQVEFEDKGQMVVEIVITLKY